MIGKTLFYITILALCLNLSNSEICGPGCLSCGLTQCEICDSQNYYVLSPNGSCVKKLIDNCEIPSTDMKDLVCYQCLPGYVLNQNGKTCQEVPNKYQVPDCERYHWDFSCLECKTKYFLNENRKCEESSKEIENCKVYKDSVVCSKCNNGYFFNISSKKCEPISQITNCKVYSSIECQKCSTGYFKPKDFTSGNKLTTNFLQALVSYNLSEDKDLLYENEPVNNCAPGIVPNCHIHSAHDICKECVEGYFLTYQGKCNEFPTRSIAFCAVYENSSTCKKCDAGYYLKKNKCYDLLHLDGCLEYYEQEQECLKCNLPTHYLGNGNCYRRTHSLNLAFCQNLNPTSDTCAKCFTSFQLTNDKLKCLPHIPHCDSYVSSTNPTSEDYTNINTLEHICKQCESGFYLMESKRQCAPQNKKACITFESQTNNCTECSVGYYLASESCLRNTALNCKAYSITSNACESCLEGYYLNGSNCERYTAQNCLTYNLTANECASCNFGYQISTDKSSCIPSVKINCKTVDDNNNCATCPLGYYLIDGNCLPVGLRNCAIPSENARTCEECQFNFYKTSDNICKPYTAKNCLSYKATTDECETCRDKIFYLKNGSCEKYTVTNCENYSLTADECSDCPDGFIKTSDNKCLLKRLENCAIANVNSTTGLCEVCNTGFILKNDLCVELNIPGCVEYTAAECSKCRLDLFLDTTTKKCKERTQIACKEFVENEDKCLYCFDNYILNNGECQISSIAYCKTYVDRQASTTAPQCEKCFFGYYPAGDKLSCLPQDVAFCSSFTPNTNTCKECRLGYKLNNTGTCDSTFDLQNCVQYEYKNAETDPDRCITCRNGYFLNTTSYKCEPFDLINNCVEYYPNTKQCKYCTYGKKPNAAMTECEDILMASNCLKMKYNSTKCEICVEGYYLDSANDCQVQNVSNCLVYKYNENVCMRCNINFELIEETGSCASFNSLNYEIIDKCYSYNGDYSACLFCEEHYYASENKCARQYIEGCLTFTFNTNECILCDIDYTLSNNTCIKRVPSPNCERYEDHTNNCILCHGDYFLDNN